ncbi:hypothetical protein V6N13_069047 [Hibiscus sabdariffa]
MFSTVSSFTGKLESSVVSEDVVDLLYTIKVFDLNGNEIPISDLWKDRKVVVSFAHHFGFSHILSYLNHTLFSSSRLNPKKRVQSRSSARFLRLLSVSNTALDSSNGAAIATEFEDPSSSYGRRWYFSLM